MVCMFLIITHTRSSSAQPKHTSNIRRSRRTLTIVSSQTRCSAAGGRTINNMHHTASAVGDAGSHTMMASVEIILPNRTCGNSVFIVVGRTQTSSMISLAYNEISVRRPLSCCASEDNIWLLTRRRQCAGCASRVQFQEKCLCTTGATPS